MYYKYKFKTCFYKKKYIENILLNITFVDDRLPWLYIYFILYQLYCEIYSINTIIMKKKIKILFQMSKKYNKCPQWVSI